MACPYERQRQRRTTGRTPFDGLTASKARPYGRGRPRPYNPSTGSGQAARARHGMPLRITATARARHAVCVTLTLALPMAGHLPYGIPGRDGRDRDRSRDHPASPRLRRASPLPSRATLRVPQGLRRGGSKRGIPSLSAPPAWRIAAGNSPAFPYRARSAAGRAGPRQIGPDRAGSGSLAHRPAGAGMRLFGPQSPIRTPRYTPWPLSAAGLEATIVG